jgi:hypothetical protein
VTREDVLKLIPSANAWHVIGPVRYDTRTVAVDWATRNLHTCWPGHATFDELAKEMMQGAMPAPDMAKLRTLADTFDGSFPVLVPCFRHEDLKRVWSAEYPATGGPPDDALIVEDGNHRLAALALRAVQGQPAGVSEVRLFVARL